MKHWKRARGKNVRGIMERNQNDPVKVGGNNDRL